MPIASSRLLDAVGKPLSYSTSDETYNTSGLWAITKSAASFAANRYIVVYKNLNSYFEYNQTFSVAIWGRLQSGNNSNMNVMFSNQEQYDAAGKQYRGFGFGANTSTYSYAPLVTLYNQTGNYISAYGSTNMKDDAFHLYTTTYNGSGLNTGFEIYVDDTLESSITRVGTLSGTTLSTARLSFGNRANAAMNNQYMTGYLCCIALFNRVLSATDVTILYGNGKPINMSLIDGCVAFWLLGENDTLTIFEESLQRAHCGVTAGITIASVAP